MRAVVSLFLFSLFSWPAFATTPDCRPFLQIAEGTVLVDQTTPGYYSLREEDSRGRLKFYAAGRLDGGGMLWLYFKMVDEKGVRSRYLRGREQFDRIMKHFEGRVSLIFGDWSYGTNLAGVNQSVQDGLSLEQAALATWTGIQAARYGFDQVTVRNVRQSKESDQSASGRYRSVQVWFSKKSE